MTTIGGWCLVVTAMRAEDLIDCIIKLWWKLGNHHYITIYKIAIHLLDFQLYRMSLSLIRFRTDI